MKFDKKVTDFIVLEEGNIGRKAAVVTGALLTSSVLAAVLIGPLTAEAGHCHSHTDSHNDGLPNPHCDCHTDSHDHDPYCPHQNG